MSEKLLGLAVALALAAQNRPVTFVPEEATISGIHAALASGNTTCVRVVQTHLRRIEAYDDRGPALNAIITINASAVKTAAEFDKVAATRSAMRAADER
jgi:Asp-tRNA(Asn)/Glu-tRNA(Gln) amidotransferase A subunit family amidase